MSLKASQFLTVQHKMYNKLHIWYKTFSSWKIYDVNTDENLIMALKFPRRKIQLRKLSKNSEERITVHVAGKIFPILHRCTLVCVLSAWIWFLRLVLCWALLYRRKKKSDGILQSFPFQAPQSTFFKCFSCRGEMRKVWSGKKRWGDITDWGRETGVAENHMFHKLGYWEDEINITGL